MNEEVESAANGYFEKLDCSHCKQVGIKAIEHRREKCVELNGDCVENNDSFL